MLYVVLGMHKSGTTLVAEILHRSGIRMVEETVTELGYDTGNKYERLAAQQVNKNLLQCHDLESHEIPLPPRLAPAEAQRRGMEDMIRTAGAAGADWGFKDPRTCLTYGAWSPFLPAHRLIVVYRHPASVSAHYRDQAGVWSPWRALRSWSFHNRQVLRILRETAVPSLVLNYERLMAEQPEFDRLPAFVGRPVVDARKPGLHRKRPGTSATLVLLDCLFGLLGKDRPLAILRELEAVRRAQVARP